MNLLKAGGDGNGNGAGVPVSEVKVCAITMLINARDHVGANQQWHARSLPDG